MGEAKRRGNFEQRLALAIERNKILEPELDRLMKAQVPHECKISKIKYDIAKKKHMNNPLLVTSILVSLQAK